MASPFKRECLVCVSKLRENLEKSGTGLDYRHSQQQSSQQGTGRRDRVVTIPLCGAFCCSPGPGPLSDTFWTQTVGRRANRRTARKASDVRRFAVALTAQSVSRTSHFLLLSDTFCWCRLPRLRPSHPISLPSKNVKARNIALLAHFVHVFACRARSVGLPVSVRHRVKSAPTPTPPPRCFAV